MHWHSVVQIEGWEIETEFRGRHRKVMTPGRYTHLFFLDEATALKEFRGIEEALGVE